MPISEEERQASIAAGAGIREDRALKNAIKTAASNAKVTKMARLMSSKQVLTALNNEATLGKYTNESVKRMQFLSNVGMKKIETGNLGDGIEDEVLKSKLPEVHNKIQKKPSKAWRDVSAMVRDVELAKLEANGEIPSKKRNSSGVFASRVVTPVAPADLGLLTIAGERCSQR
jgi:hypothetical protein